jgi:uncharacterized protein YabN with tetrapyrrole methylase and pyrophosphatase domain
VSGGSLTVVGTGIAMGVHLTPQSRAEIERADEFLYLMVDSLSDSWIANLNPNSHSLRRHYAPDRKRSETYEAMVEQILASVRAGRDVCAAFYGHPGVCAFPSHEAIRRAREEGFPARMLPSVSAEDCLFADLGVDPGESGCQSYEATDFLLRRRKFDPTAALVLWQVAFIGVTQAPVAPAPKTFKVLVEYLLEFYDPSNEAVLYEASPYPVGRSSVRRVRLGDLADAELGPLATLYIAPRDSAGIDPAMRERLQRADVDSGATHVVASSRITTSGEEPRSR